MNAKAKFGYFKFCTLLLLQVQLIKSNSIKLPLFYNTISNKPETPIKIIGEKEESIFEVNFLSPYITTFKAENEERDIEIQNIKINDVGLVRDEGGESQKSGNIYGSFGLGVEENKKNAFIDKLYNDGIIKRKLFSICKEPNSKNLYVDIGRVSKELNDNQNKLFLCDFKGSKYECDINEIGIQSKNLFKGNELKFVLDISERFIEVPIQFLFFLDEYYFNPLVKEDKCNLGLNNKDTEYTFICFEKDLRAITSLPNLVLTSGGQSFILNPKDLFYKNQEGNYIFFLKARKENIKNQDTFTFGLNFFSMFEALFDLEKSQIGLYNQNYVIKGANTKNDYPTAISSADLRKTLIIFLLVLLSIVVLPLLFRKISYLKAQTPKAKQEKYYQMK